VNDVVHIQDSELEYESSKINNLDDEDFKIR
jgi:hypothetical protein